MEDLKEKLSAFKAIVLEDAGLKRDELIGKVQAKHDTLVNKKEDEFLAEAYDTIQRSILDSKRAANERLLHIELEAKKKLLLTREEIINEIMNGAKDKLKAYTATEAYKKWLIDKTKKSLIEVGKGSKIVYISSDDLRFKEEIEGLNNDESEISVEAVQENDFIGGVRVFNTERRVSVDYSLKELLAEERKGFLQKSGLTID